MIALLRGAAANKLVQLRGPEHHLPVLEQFDTAGSVQLSQVDQFEEELATIQDTLQPFGPEDGEHVTTAIAAGLLTEDGRFVTSGGADVVKWLREHCLWARAKKAGFVVEDSARADLVLKHREKRSTQP